MTEVEITQDFGNTKMQVEKDVPESADGHQLQADTALEWSPVQLQHLCQQFHTVLQNSRQLICHL